MIAAAWSRFKRWHGPLHPPSHLLGIAFVLAFYKPVPALMLFVIACAWAGAHPAKGGDV